MYGKRALFEEFILYYAAKTILKYVNPTRFWNQFTTFAYYFRKEYMPTNIGDFFIASNSVSAITEEDYQKATILVNAAKAFARSTHQCVYIIDYFKQNFLYVSENLAYWCGESSDKIKDFGYQFYIDYVPEKEQLMLLEINNQGFDLFNKIPISERLDYTISYDFHIKNGKKQRLVNHHITPMILSQDGRIWLALCTISMSAKNTPGHIIMKKSNSTSYYEYSLDKHKWINKESVTLNETERDVLTLSAQGYTMNEIADKLCKSVDTIKSYKRALFSKLDVKNIAEALSYATNYKLL